jgi:ligand-binding sensor domain-containing protein/DNA-binding CsgD family transcriptional regulator
MEIIENGFATDRMLTSPAAAPSSAPRSAAGLLVALLAVFASLRLGADAGSPVFRNIAIEDGLSQNTVTSICSDRRGFMWFGTDGGLNRYDGHDFKVFTYRRRDANSLSHDRINNMVEDADGTFWIGTTGGGLSHFDPLTETFTCFRSVPGDPGSISNDSLRVVLPTPGGTLWVGTDNGLNRFDRRGRAFRRYLCAGESVEPGPRNAIYSLFREADGTLWVGSGDGLYRLAPGQETFRRFECDRSDRYASRRNQINAIFADDHGSLWLGTEGGLARFDRGSGALQFKAESEQKLPHLYRSRIFAVQADRQGRVWIATESGVYLIARRDLLAIYFQAGAVPQRLLTNRFAISVYQDREDIVWVGTLSGVFKYDLRNRQFSMYGSELIDKERESGTFPVTAVCRDDGGRLWIGTYKHGLIRLDDSPMETITPIPLANNPLDENEIAVTALRVAGGRTLWIGTNRGLFAYDLARGALGAAYGHTLQAGSLSHDQVTTLFEDRSGRLWVGTQDGLNRFDRARGTFTVFRNDSGPIGRNNIMAIVQDGFGHLWVGTYGGGLSRFDAEQGRFLSSYRQRPGDETSLSSDKVYALLEDARGRFWVGTNSGGLCRFDRARGTFTRIDTEDGLANNDIMAMLEDRRGNLWLSTNRGLCQYDPQRRGARNFSSRDGLQGDEFMPLSCYQAADGEMFFGGINGLTAFYPERIKGNPYVPPVVITGVEVFNRGRVFSGDLSRMDRLRLGPGDRIVSFAFAALSFSDPRRNQYAYRIEGLDDDWIDIGNRHEVTVSNLRPGSYVFRVKGTNNHGVWNEQGAALAITMSPPWWQSWWFRLPAFLLLLLALVQWSRSRTRRMAARIRTEAAMDKFYEKHGISEREKEILMLVLRGKSNKEIEDALFIAIGTVKNHIYNIYQKIGVKNRAQLMALFKNLQVK